MSLDLALRNPLTSAWLAPEPAADRAPAAPAADAALVRQRTVAQRLSALLDDADALVCRFEVDDAFERDLPRRRR
ncbi:MAG: hypothetical protein MUC74_09925 [Ideonella sp.]|jgi:hypothetical protein|nr:hypothetical protein [Ideonella sp.]